MTRDPGVAAAMTGAILHDATRRSHPRRLRENGAPGKAKPGAASSAPTSKLAGHESKGEEPPLSARSETGDCVDTALAHP